GEIAMAVEEVAQAAEQVFNVLRDPTCLTGKQEVLLKEAREAQAEQRALCVVCANETMQQAVQSYLGAHKIDVIAGCVRVMTRSRLRRTVAAGTHSAAELLLLTPLGWGEGFHFSGIASVIRLSIY